MPSLRSRQFLARTLAQTLSRFLWAALISLSAARVATAQTLPPPQPAQNADANPPPLGEKNPDVIPEDDQDLSMPTQKTVWVAHLLRRKQVQFRIKNLELLDARVPIYLVNREPELRPTVSVHGHFERPGWKLFLSDDLPVHDEGGPHEFVVNAHLRGRVNEMTLTALGPGGEKETETIYIYAPEAMEFHVVSAWDQVLLSVGGSYLIYAQAGFGEYRSISAVLSARYNTTESPNARWGFLGSASMNVLTFVSAPVDRGPQLLDAKADLTYVLRPEGMPRWRTQVLAGLNYLTMFSYGSPFGFSDLLAPEIGVRARYTQSAQKARLYEARLTYLADFPHIDQLGLNLSTGWSRMVSESHRVEYGINYSYYFYRPTPDIPIRIHQLTFQIGLSI